MDGGLRAATRLDVRRLQLPRLPLAEQRRFGERFRALAAFEDALRQTSRLGDQLVATAIERALDGRDGVYDVTVTVGDDVVAEFVGRSREIGGPVWEGPA